MLCFGRRKKCFEKGEEEFTRLHEEPPSVQKTGNNGGNYKNNIAHVTSPRVLVANGKPLQAIKPNGLYHQQRKEQNQQRSQVPTKLSQVSTKPSMAPARPSQTSAKSNPNLHTQTLDYKHLHNRNNIYRPGKNSSVTVQRSASAHYPSKPHISQREPVRPHSQVIDSTTRYVKLDDVHLDWVVNNTNEQSNNVPQGAVVPPRTNTSYSVNHAKDHDALEQTLAQLDDTLKSYCIEVFEGDSTDDETNGRQSDKRKVNKSIDKESPQTDSGIVSSSDSLSSNTSRHGIIANGELKTGSKRTSVSFRLPENHVDKPYNPLQFTKPKSKSSSSVTVAPNHTSPNGTNVGYCKIPSICVWDSQNKVWHVKDGVVYSQDSTTEYMYPFRGSFLNLFYGKYANGEIKTNDIITRGKAYLAPGILQKIESYESLAEADYAMSAQNSGKDIRRHSIAHY